MGLATSVLISPLGSSDTGQNEGPVPYIVEITDMGGLAEKEVRIAPKERAAGPFPHAAKPCGGAHLML